MGDSAACRPAILMIAMGVSDLTLIIPQIFTTSRDLRDVIAEHVGVLDAKGTIPLWLPWEYRYGPFHDGIP